MVKINKLNFLKKNQFFNSFQHYNVYKTDINGKPVTSGEVHVFVVDQKVLDLAPHAVLSAQNGFKTNLDSAYYYVSDSQRFLQLKDQFGITAEQVDDFCFVLCFCFKTMAVRAGVLGKSTLDHPWTQVMFIISIFLFDLLNFSLFFCCFNS